MDLSTTYLGMKIRNPIVPSASPLSRNISTIRQMEDKGASAVVLYSLFEEWCLAGPDARRRRDGESVSGTA